MRLRVDSGEVLDWPSPSAPLSPSPVPAPVGSAPTAGSGTPSNYTVFGPSQPLRERHRCQGLRHAGRRGAAPRGRSTAQRHGHGRSAAGHRPRTDGDVGLARSSRGDRVLNHVMLNWNPQGHEPPELFGKPHFDFHFDMVDMATMQAINPDDPEVRGGGRTPSRGGDRPPGVRRSPRPSARGPGRARHGPAHGRLHRQHTRARQIRFPEDRHQRRMGRPLHLHRTDDHPRVAAHPAQLTGEPQAAPGVPEDGLLPDHIQHPRRPADEGLRDRADRSDHARGRLRRPFVGVPMDSNPA